MSYDSKIEKCFASYSQRRLRKGCIVCLYSSKRRFNRPSLLTRRSALVIKVGVSYCTGGEAFERRLVHSVAEEKIFPEAMKILTSNVVLHL